MRNMNGIFNKEELIENTMKVNIYYQGHRERMKIDVIRGQKWNMILGMLWLTCHNSDIDQRIREIKMTRYPRIQKVVETKARKIKVRKTKERRREREREKEVRGERIKKKEGKKTKRNNNRSK